MEKNQLQKSNKTRKVAKFGIALLATLMSMGSAAYGLSYVFDNYMANESNQTQQKHEQSYSGTAILGKSSKDDSSEHKTQPISIDDIVADANSIASQKEKTIVQTAPEQANNHFSYVETLFNQLLETYPNFYSTVVSESIKNNVSPAVMCAIATLEGGLQQDYARGETEVKILKPFENSIGMIGRFALSKYAIADVNNYYRTHYTKDDAYNTEKGADIAIKYMKLNKKRLKENFPEMSKQELTIATVMAYNLGITSEIKNIRKYKSVENYLNAIYDQTAGKEVPQELSYPFIVRKYALGFKNAMQNDDFGKSNLGSLLDPMSKKMKSLADKVSDLYPSNASPFNTEYQTKHSSKR